MSDRWLLRGVEVDGAVLDVTVADGTVQTLGTHLPVPAGAEVLEGGGGALLPGLWDHHIHLLALAAARRSVHVGPPAVRTREQLARVLATHRPADPATWVRAVGYHESVAGPLDRHELDRLLPGVAVRVQHRSGALWVLSSEAIRRLGIEHVELDGLERDGTGRLTGQLYGLDRWLRERLAPVAPQPPPELSAVGAELAAYGVVGVTDATPSQDLDDLVLLADARASGALPVHVVATGGPALSGATFPAPLRRGPVKLLLADHALPSLDELVGWITTAHAHARPVAVHCVSRESLVLAVVALDEAGSLPGDRVEHGAVVPPELHDALRRHRLTIVTQPNLVAERGDRYRVEVDAHDLPHLYPCASLLADGIAVAGSTDAPFGHPDPWRAIAAAVHRRTADGHPLGATERLPAARALALFLGEHGDPGGRSRSVHLGAAADLCLLHLPLAEALVDPHAGAVRATFVAGRPVHGT